MVAESTISSSYESSSCYDVPTIDHCTATHISITTRVMCSAMSHQHSHVEGLLQFLTISIYTLAAYDISLASTFSEVSDDND